MEESQKEEQRKKNIPQVQTFTVPFTSVEVKENITITTNNPSKPSKEQIINQAIQFHLKGNIPKATKYYQQLINQECNDYRVFSNYGAILQGLGKSKEAEASLRKAVELNPDLAESHSYLGNLLNDLGKFKEAEASLRKAVELNPNLALAHAYLGILLNDLGQLKEAEASLKKAIKLKFGSVKAYDALSNVLNKLGRKKEAEESSKKILYLTPVSDSKLEDKRKGQNNMFTKPSPIEYPIFYRPGMGTENVGSFLRSMVMMLRPKRVLEIGAGYTTPFLLEALINNERVFDDGNLSESYFQNYNYEAKLVVIDNQSLGNLTKVPGMKDIVNSKYTEFIEGTFEGKAKELSTKYSHFDFVWFDCGGPKEYLSFIQEYWEYCSNYILFHFTYRDGKPNVNHKIIHDNIKGNPVIIDIVEPHKKRQGSITMVKKENFKK
ncbi:Hypothetical protein NATL1_00431 [Prochlorococcus marinus str. NATL1A]|uniref:Uncharacterized protein n=1 Tax=Prochlorococcus marinus (strain NATL1A) TaxID=167555 RepID=A2BZE7_PROM1|nr:tetratricopeptide repeat protein [Prochlorococcus marinus]ABM74607.1 Hypothetical protein NATL1_00431 [Prochlorococcus marinus str. NATL1A]